MGLIKTGVTLAGAYGIAKKLSEKEKKEGNQPSNQTTNYYPPPQSYPQQQGQPMRDSQPAAQPQQAPSYYQQPPVAQGQTYGLRDLDLSSNPESTTGNWNQSTTQRGPGDTMEKKH